jgi:UDP-N-acetylglucosamine/UDP-N-acetylgalactosamine diphosphorylase
MIIETTRLGDFSPVKNAEGVDSAVTCRADQQRLFAQWLTDVGVSVEKDSEGVPLRKIEVSPLFGYDLETFRESWEKRGLDTDFSQDTYIE